jgi:CelD/BcsL family acetyltransferase involved in cellulose biosynthesis
MQVSIHQGLSGLLQLRDDWLELQVDAGLFARYEWNLAAAAHLLPPGASISFCRIRDERGTVAIVPAVQNPVKVRPFPPRPAISLGLSPELAQFDFPMRGDADAAAVGAALLRALRTLDKPWKFVCWSRVPVASNAARVAGRMRDSRVVMTSSSVCNSFDTTRGPSVFFDQLPKNMRINLRRYGKRLAQEGSVQVRMAREEHDVRRFFEDFLAVEGSGWKGIDGEQSAVALRPQVRAFYEALLSRSSPDFETDIAILYVSSEPVAVQFLVRAGRCQHVYKIGYDERFSRYSPGQLLLGAVLERACESESIDRVSLVTGLPWHQNWCPDPEPTLQVLIFRDHWRPLILRSARAGSATVRAVGHWAHVAPDQSRSHVSR